MAKQVTNEQAFHYKNNRLQQLRGFCYTVQFGSVNRAAEHMGLGQSSISLQIKALEEDMGCQLFVRNGPRLTLSADGAKLYDMAKPLVEGIQNLRQEFYAANHTRTSQTLILAANSTAQNYLLPEVLREYQDSFPDIRFVIHTVEHHEALLLLLKSKEIDAAVLPRRAHLTFPDSFEYVPTHRYATSLITRSDHPLAGKANIKVSQIRRYPLTLPSRELAVVPNLYEVLLNGDSDDMLKVKFVNSETGRAYIEAGIAITVSSNVWLADNDTLVATPLPHLFDGVDYGVVRLRNKQDTPQVSRFINIMQSLGNI